MEYKKILLTGSSGELGQEIIKSKLFEDILIPSRKELDITNSDSVKSFFSKNDFDAIIHCAALARMKECELNPENAIETNIIGTCNIVIETLKKEKALGKKIRLVFLSTDGVYPGTDGGYSEKDAAIPYNKYGWTKLGAECPINLLSNFCILRTSFFDPVDIRFEDAATDAYSSKIPVRTLAKSIKILFYSDFVGTINVGSERKSDYERYKQFKPQIKPCLLKDIQKEVNFSMYQDSSMDITLWKSIQKNEK